MKVNKRLLKFEVFLCFTIKKPEVSHLHCVGALAFDGIVDNFDSGSVVDVNRCWWLWVSKFCKSEMEDLGFLCIEKEGTQFLFGSGCGDKFEYCTCDVDGACENILHGYLYVFDLAFVILKGIYGFKFPKRFLDIFSRDLTSSFLFCKS
jgi:hypothetical protein